MQPDQACKHLLSVLRSHHIALSDEHIQSAFENESSREDVTKWVQQYLSEETLLSFEEAQLYSRLEKQNVSNQVTASNDLSIVRPLSDEDFENAIKILEASTSAIEEQNRSFNIQQEALAEFQKKNGRAQTQLKRATSLRQRNLLQEKQNTLLAADNLLQKLSKEISVAQDELHSNRVVSLTNISDLLKYDDNKISKINLLASSVTVSNDEDRLQLSNMEALCTRLKTYMAGGIRCHLDRVYLETILSSKNYGVSNSSEEPDLETSLKTELGTLYTEIENVAQMSVYHEFSEPLSKIIKRESALREDGIRTTFDNIDANMKQIQDKIDNIFLQLQTHDSHCLALGIIMNECSKLGLEKSTNSSRSRMKRTPSLIDKDNHVHQKRPQNDLDTGKLTDIEDDVTQQSHRQLLQVLGCPLFEDSNSHSIQDLLNRTASTRVQNARMGVFKMHTAIDSLLDTNLESASIINQIIVDRVLEDSKWQEVHLMDEHLKSRIAKLETETGRIGSAMENLDFDKLRVVSKNCQDFVNRWNTRDPITPN